MISAGMSLLMPAGYASTWEGASAASARLRIPTVLVKSAEEQIGLRASRVEIRNVFETRDLMIERLALILLMELELAPHLAQVLIVEQISAALATHLLRKYNVFAPIVKAEA